jgi:sulfatase maturation enzyme AslB (radical SAM superfamily)
MSLEEVKQIFPGNFVKQLDEIQINGNFGDAVMNAETPDIVEYFKLHNPQVTVVISTNGGARDSNFWERLGRAGAKILFCIDGVDDVHSLYRINTSFNTVIKNAITFIGAGGTAVWKMIDFAHNQHQQGQAKQLSKELGFAEFYLVNHGRNNSPVFNNQQELTHTIGEPDETNFELLWSRRTGTTVTVDNVSNGKQPQPINCHVKTTKSLYISSTGDVYPCCFTGFAPKSYGHGNYHQAANQQLIPLIKNNNALQHTLETCIKWFNDVESSWDIPEFDQGRLLICNDVCGEYKQFNPQKSINTLKA